MTQSRVSLNDINITQKVIVLDLLMWKRAQDAQNLRLKWINITVFSQSTKSFHMLFHSSWNNSKVLYQLELLAYFQHDFMKEEMKGLIIPLPLRQSVQKSDPSHRGSFWNIIPGSWFLALSWEVLNFASVLSLVSRLNHTLRDCHGRHETQAFLS